MGQGTWAYPTNMFNNRPDPKQEGLSISTSNST